MVTWIENLSLKLFLVFGIAIVLKVYQVQATFHLQQIIENIHQEYSESSDLQSPNVNFTYDGKQWAANLTCTFTYADTAEISWHVQGRRIDDSICNETICISNTFSDNQVESILTINNFTYENVNQYICLLAQPSGYTNYSVWAAPKPVINEGNDAAYVNVNEADQVTLKCATIGGAPLFWHLPGFSEGYEGLVITDDSTDDRASISADFKLNAWDSSHQYKCCMSMTEFGQPPQCATFPVLVLSQPIRVNDVICSNITKKCNVGVIFFAYPYLDEHNITWNSSSPTVDVSDYTFHSFGLLCFSYLKVKLEDANYTCTADNGFGWNEFSMQIYGTTASYRPIVTIHNGKYNKEKDSARFFCTFESHPRPNLDDVYWLKIRLGDQSNGTETIVNTTSTLIKVVHGQGMRTLTTLDISEFTKFNEFVYICGASNEFGEDYRAVAFNESLKTVQIAVNDTYVKGDSIIATCQADGYPLPKISWKIISEFDVQYNITDETDDYNSTDWSISTVTIETDEKNSYIHIECSAYNVFEPSKKLNAFKTIKIIHEPVILFVSSCTEDSFESNQNCTLSCDFQSTNTSTLFEWDWRYYASTPGQYQSLDWANMKNITPYRTRLTLDLSSYNGGTYRCYALFHYIIDNAQLNEYKFNDFNIYPNTGKAVNQSCANSGECVSLYATCSNNICQCIQPYYIPYDKTANTLECLTPAFPNDPCLTNQQCQEGENNYICKNKISTDALECTCNGSVRDVVEAHEQLCLQPALYEQKCTYTEECMLNDINTICDPNKCECAPDYGYDSYFKKCVYVSTGNLSVSAIVVIIIACFLLTALVVSLLTGYMKTRRHSPLSNRGSSNATLAPEESETDISYSHFSNPSYTERAVDVGDDFIYEQQELHVVDGHNESTETDQVPENY